MLGALVSGAASLVGGLFGRSSAKKQAEKEERAIKEANEKAEQLASQMNKEIRARADAAALVPVQRSRENLTRGGVDMDGFMQAAEDYGFNPLTFLRSGALSAFAYTYSDDFECVTGERAMDAALSGTYLPQLSPVISSTKVPSAGEVFGNALQTGVNQWLSDSSQQSQNDFQMKLLNAQLAGANKSGSGNLARSFYTPSATTFGSKTKTTNAAQIPNLYVPYRDNSAAGGGRTVWLPNPDIADSEQLTSAGVASGWGATKQQITGSDGTGRQTTIGDVGKMWPTERYLKSWIPPEWRGTSVDDWLSWGAETLGRQ